MWLWKPHHKFNPLHSYQNSVYIFLFLFSFFFCFRRLFPSCRCCRPLLDQQKKNKKKKYRVSFVCSIQFRLILFILVRNWMDEKKEDKNVTDINRLRISKCLTEKGRRHRIWSNIPNTHTQTQTYRRKIEIKCAMTTNIRCIENDGKEAKSQTEIEEKWRARGKETKCRATEWKERDKEIVKKMKLVE